ncbi:hypothetical protein DLAC_11843 [Tieghemostelium lacteum]|uniref:Ribosomal protein/NADH dehydrogenase domain-containing protein n=1 Tax=Tieghemostelium lacteum TaxID=361077 RepID=A0A151Z3A2_TIELA|nr:hypothetical protein DLAC_11843 [Tieghemostelium lacteum]|eukprot:KYQ88425.1 hypothetical protein DLAC_11843 [Tieghemostelium lacteum]
MSMKRFYDILGLKKPQNFRQLLKAYCHEKVYLYDAKQITFCTSKTGQGNTGSRIFKYQYLEPFQFWNKEVSFKTIKLNNGNPYVEVETLSGEIHKIDTKNINATEILNKVLQVSKGKKISVNIPDV